MKTIFNTAITALIVLLLISCKKEKSVIKKDTYLTANINGKEFKSTLEIVAFKANGQTYLCTADNSGKPEYEFKLIIENKKENPDIKRYGFVELKDSENRKNNKIWALPNNFNFTITNDAETYLEGSFSYIATPTGKNSNKQIELIFTEGKFKANKKRY